jgi:predicted nucleotidyltransferase
MRPSRRYKEMARAIEHLRTALLPGTFSDTGTYARPRHVHIRTVSFRVLAHAEIESYLEDRASEIHGVAWELWKKYRQPSHTLTCLLGFSGVSTFPPAESLTVLSGGQRHYVDIAIPLDKANNVWKDNLRRNNGLRERDVLSLLLPIGVQHSILDQTLLNDLNSFGSARGEVAHTSTVGVTTFFDPKTEYSRVLQILEALSGLDEALEDQVTVLARVLRRERKLVAVR